MVIDCCTLAAMSGLLTSCPSRNALLVSHPRDHAELLHQAQHVQVRPLFSDLAVGDAKYTHTRHHELLAGWRDSREVACVRAPIAHAGCYLVPFCNQILNRDAGRWECRKTYRAQLFCGPPAWRQSWSVIQIIGGEKLVYLGEVVLVNVLF